MGGSRGSKYYGSTPTDDTMGAEGIGAAKDN